MKKKTPSAKQSEDELPFSFKKAVITSEKTEDHWQRIASKLRSEDNTEDQETDITSTF